MIKKIKSILALISAVVLIIGSIVTTSTNIKSCNRPEKKSTDNNIIIKGKENKTLVGNGNAIQENNITVNNISVNKKASKIQYSVIGTSNKKLLKDLKGLKKIEIVSDSKNIIEVTYTGEITSLNNDSNTFIYSGGNILIKVNNLNCFEFENMKIAQMRPNSKNTIMNEIQKKIDTNIDNDPKLFINKIAECINNY